MLRRNVTAVLLLVFCCLALPVAAQAACTATGAWVNNPDLPDQIPAGGGLCARVRQQEVTVGPTSSDTRRHSST